MAYLGFVPSGVVLPFAGATAPQGWILCDGSAVSRSTYAALFSAISTAHGSGDGSTTFNLPDYRGRIMRGRDGGIARDPDRASRTAANSGGNTGDNVGSVQGDSIYNHTHPITVNSLDPAHYERYGANSPSTVGTPAGVDFNVQDHFHTGSSSNYTFSSGETRPINAYVNYIIKI